MHSACAAAASIALALVAAPIAQAQDYPNRAVTIVAPAAPGGLYSLFARLIGSKLEQRLGKPFIVENRPGASSIVGAMSVIRAPHDGYTLMVAQHQRARRQRQPAQEPALRSGQGFRADRADRRAFPRCWWSTPRCRCIRWPIWPQLAKATPGGLSYGSAGAGTGAASQRRAARERARRGADACALQGHVAGDQRRGRRPHPVHVQPDPVRAAAGAGRQAPHARRHHGRARSRRSRTCRRSPRSASRASTRRPGSCWWRRPARRPASSRRLHREVRAVTVDPQVQSEFSRLGLVPVRSPPPDELQALCRGRDRALGRYRAEGRSGGVAIGGFRKGRRPNGRPARSSLSIDRPRRSALRIDRVPERWQSGRLYRTRNAAYGQPYRGFESHPLRHHIVML